MSGLREPLRQRVQALYRGRGIDRPLAVMMAIGAVLLFAFVKLADEVIEGDTQTIDEALLLALRTPGDISQPVGPLWLQEMVRDFTALGSIGVLTIFTFAVVIWLLFL